MKRFDQVNVIPFIDIMLVLLAIVLTTATFVPKEQMAVDLPQTQDGEAPSRTEAIELVIDSQHQIYWQDSALDLRALKERLTRLDAESEIRLLVDQSVDFGVFVGVMEALKAQGLHRVAIVTRRAPIQ